MPKVIVLYRLRPGISKSEFEQWSRDVDQKVMIRQPGVTRYEIYRIEGAHDGSPAYDYAENIDVEDWEQWQGREDWEDLKPLVPAFERMVESEKMVMLWGERV